MFAEKAQVEPSTSAQGQLERWSEIVEYVGKVPALRKASDPNKVRKLCNARFPELTREMVLRAMSDSRK